MYVCVRVCMHSVVSDSVTAWTVACQDPLSMGFSKQYWSGLPFPIPGDLPSLKTEPASLASPALAGRLFTTAPAEKSSHKPKITQFGHKNEKLLQ